MDTVEEQALGRLVPNKDKGVILEWEVKDGSEHV